MKVPNFHNSKIRSHQIKSRWREIDYSILKLKKIIRYLQILKIVQALICLKDRLFSKIEYFSLHKTDKLSMNK